MASGNQLVSFLRKRAKTVQDNARKYMDQAATKLDEKLKETQEDLERYLCLDTMSYVTYSL
jgi:hypothetical protein